MSELDDVLEVAQRVIEDFVLCNTVVQHYQGPSGAMGAGGERLWGERRQKRVIDRGLEVLQHT